MARDAQTFVSVSPADGGVPSKPRRHSSCSLVLLAGTVLGQGRSRARLLLSAGCWEVRRTLPGMLRCLGDALQAAPCAAWARAAPLAELVSMSLCLLPLLQEDHGLGGAGFLPAHQGLLQHVPEHQD